MSRSMQKKMMTVMMTRNVARSAANPRHASNLKLTSSLIARRNLTTPRNFCSREEHVLICHPPYVCLGVVMEGIYLPSCMLAPESNSA